MVEIKLKPGMKFKYKGIDFICLDIINGNYLAITAECWCIKRFNEKFKDGCNNWEKSTLRRFLNEDVLEEHFNTEDLIKQTSDLVADNGDKAYGTCEDYITMLTCDQYRKYRDYVPHFEECMWTLTPRRCDTGYASSVRFVYPKGAFSSDYAYYTRGIAPVCLFNSQALRSEYSSVRLVGIE